MNQKDLEEGRPITLTFTWNEDDQKNLDQDSQYPHQKSDEVPTTVQLLQKPV
jgi:hypothetical protein